METNDAAEPARHEEPEPNDVRHSRGPVSAEPGVADYLRPVVSPLDDLEERPVGEHAEAYDAVHRDLRAMLDEIDTR